MFLAALAVDVHVHDTYFVVAHFHFIMVGGTVMGYMGGIAFLVAEDHRADVSGRLGRVRRSIIFVGFQPDFFPAVRAGLSRHAAAVPRYPPEFQVLNVMSTAGASILALGTCCRCFICLVPALRQSRGTNPWDATGLEWAARRRQPE